MSGPVNLAILTHSPSPYQVELFNFLSTDPGVNLTALYLYSRDSSRQWRQLPMSHRNVYLDTGASRSKGEDAVMQADLAVMNYYANPAARRLISEQSRHGKPWVFWGERPGYRLPLAVGRLVRKVTLRALHASRVPIWGIGSVAVDSYRAEFGNERSYHNIPYFSDLSRFDAIRRDFGDRRSERTFLFSGSLTMRKGIDLLIKAFLRLAGEFPNVRLKVMGTGPLLDDVKKSTAKVSARVEFLGFKDWSELPAIYASADILCVPSRYDGWGLVVPEGLAAGMPVIATDQTGAALDFIKTGNNGWLARAGDENSLFSAMSTAAQLPMEQFAELSANARDSVEEHSLRHGAERFLTAAREAISAWQS